MKRIYHQPISEDLVSYTHPYAPGNERYNFPVIAKIASFSNVLGTAGLVAVLLAISAAAIFGTKDKIY